MMAKLLRAFSRIPRFVGEAGASAVASGASTHVRSFFTAPERRVSYSKTTTGRESKCCIILQWTVTTNLSVAANTKLETYRTFQSEVSRILFL